MPTTDQVIGQETTLDETVLDDVDVDDLHDEEYEAPAVHIRASVCPENCY